MKTKITQTKKQPRTMVQWLLCTLLIVLSGVTTMFGQTSIYSFSSTTGNSLTTMTSPVNLLTQGLDDNQSAITSVGFTFNFAGVDYTQFWVSPNGVLGFGAPDGAYNNNDNINQPLIPTSIMPFWDDMHTGTGGYVQYQVFGASPSRTLVVEWSTVHCCSGTPDKMFQVWMTETTNQIQFVYGAGAGTNDATIGIANSDTDFMSITATSNSASSTTRFNDNDWPGSGTAYIFDMPPPTACAGPVTPGTTLSTANPICGGSTFTLSMSTSYVSVSGLTMQWQSSPDGSTWSDIAGANSSSYTTSITASTYYQCYVTCGVDNGTSTALQVNATPFVIPEDFEAGVVPPGCWTTSDPTLLTWQNFSAFGTGTGSIRFDFYDAFPGTNLNFESPVFTPVASGVQLSFDEAYAGYDDGAGGVYNDQLIILTSSDGGMTYSPLITYNGDATGELNTAGMIAGFYDTPLSSEWQTKAIMLPAGTNRILFDGLSAFGNELYVDNINMVLLSACTGTPAPGNTLTSAAMGCPTQPLTLSVQNPVSASMVTYQWQTSPDGSTWTDVAGANGTSYTLTQTVATWYQCVVTCTAAGGGSATTTALFVDETVCYCTTPVYSFGSGCSVMNYIDNFNFAGINNTSGCSTYYNYYNTMTASVEQTGSYAVSISTPVNPAGYYQLFKVYIDYDNNGSFDDIGEMVYTSGFISTGSNSSAGTINIPLTAPLGMHRLRVRSSNHLGATIDANSCSDDGVYGEVEDYNISIDPAPACSGTPTPGMTIASTPLACSATTINLSLQNSTPGLSISYVWESSPDASFASSVTTIGTGPTATATETGTMYYRCGVTCGTNTGTSTPVMVTYSVPCYCTTPADGSDGCGVNLYIDNVTFAGINNTSGCFNPVPYASNGYSYFPAATATVQQGQSYTISVSTPANASGFFQYYMAWIDYNDNGSYEDIGELVFDPGNTNTSINTSTGMVAIPLTAPTGMHMMRVRSGNVGSPINSCSDNAVTGETEDYNVNLMPAPACSGTPAANTTVSSANPACPGMAFDLSLSSAYTDAGITYQWQSSPTGSGYTDIAGANAPMYSATQMNSMYYQCAITCSSAGGGTTISTPIYVTNSVFTLPETFSAGVVPPGCWTINDPIYMLYGASSGYGTGTGSIMYDFYDLTSGTLDFTSPTMAPTAAGAKLVFDEAYATYIGGGYNDQLIVLASTDGGANYTPVITYTGDISGDLNTGGDVASPFVPTSAQWQTKFVTLPTGTNKIMLEGISAYGNNLYIDNINIVDLPTIACPATANINTDAGTCTSSSSIGTPTTTGMGTTSAVDNGGPYSVGTTTVTWTVTDAFGGTATCSQDVMVADMESPMVSCPATTSIMTDAGMCTSSAAIGTATAMDNCSVGTVMVDNAGPYALGSTTVTWTAMDVNGNSATCTQLINVVDAEAPTITAPADITVCSGATVTLGTATGTDNCGTVTFANDAPTSFPVGLTIVTWVATDGSGNTSAAAQNVNVNPNPTGTTASFIICDGSSVSYTPFASIAGSSFSWTAANTIGTVTGYNDCPLGCTIISDVLSNLAGSGGVVVYTVTAHAPTGCTSPTFPVTVTVATIPAPPVLAGPFAACGLGSATFTATSLYATSYVWTVPTGVTIISGAGTSALTCGLTGFTNPGMLTCTTSNNCGSSTTTSQLLSKKPAPPVSISGPSSVCGLTTAIYSILPSAAATSYSWTLPAGMAITAGAGTTQITVSINAALVLGNMRVDAVNACGYVAGPLMLITGHAPATPGTLTGPTNVCGLNSATYSIPNVAYATGYTWTVPSWMTITAGAGTTSITVMASGSPAAGTVSVAGTNVCGTGTARSITLNINAALPGAISGPANICGITSATYTIVPLGSGYTYNWTLAMTGHTISSGAGTTSITVTGPATATSSAGLVKVTSTNGCASTSGIRTLGVTYCHSAIANADNQNGNTFSTLYPNPTTGEFRMDVTTDMDEEMTVMVYDVLGNLIISEKHTLVNGTTTIATNLEKYNSGLYFVRLVDSNAGTVYSQTVVKQ